MQNLEKYKNIRSLVRFIVGAIPWSQTGATRYHEQLGLPDKGRAIIKQVV